MHSDDDALLVDVDFSPPARFEARADPDVVDLTSDCEDAARPSGARQTAAKVQEAVQRRKRAALPIDDLAGVRQPKRSAPVLAPLRSSPLSPPARWEQQQPLQPLPPLQEPEEFLTAAERKRRAAEEARAAKAAEKARKAAQKEAEKAEKARARQQAKEEKAAAKKAEQQAKAHAREVVRQQRGRLADQEIQVLLSTDLAMLPAGHQMMERLRAKQYSFTIAPAVLAPLPCVSWRRCSALGGTATDAGSQFQPVEGSAVEVPYVLIYLKADEFVAEVEGGTVEALLQRAAAAHPTCTLALLIEGLHHYLQQRERSEFRAAGGPGAGTTFNCRPTQQAVMQLVTRYPGVRHRIVHDAAQAAEHVQMLTRALAHQPYKFKEMFLEVHGTAGDSTAAQELLVREPLAPEQLPLYRILNHTPSMGPAAAHVLAQQYRNLGNLMAAEFLNPSKGAGAVLRDIADLQKPSENRRRIGPAAAQKLFRVLTASDPELPVDERHDEVPV